MLPSSLLCALGANETRNVRRSSDVVLCARLTLSSPPLTCAPQVQERRAMRGLAASARIQGQYRSAIKHLERVLEISQEFKEFTGARGQYDSECLSVCKAVVVWKSPTPGAYAGDLTRSQGVQTYRLGDPAAAPHNVCCSAPLGLLLAHVLQWKNVETCMTGTQAAGAATRSSLSVST